MQITGCIHRLNVRITLRMLLRQLPGHLTIYYKTSIYSEFFVFLSVIIFTILNINLIINYMISMKFFSSLVIAPIMVLLFITGLTIRAQVKPANSGTETSMAFRAGAATANITPFLGGGIIGGWNSPPATHIHDELHARCLVLDDGDTKLAFVVVDLLQI